MQVGELLEERFFHSIKELIEPSDKVLLTVSGGIDSVVMLHLFLQTSYKVAIAHCNFQLRGQDANDDETFVQQLAEKHHIPFYSIHFDTQKYAKQLGFSIQMAARELRYEWFREIAQKNNFAYIATAHQRNDVLETFFVNALRKTGIKGLCGIQAKTGMLIRPMLAFSRQEISDYASSSLISYREDKSNDSDYYARNYIRHHIIPAFNKLQDNFEDTLSETIAILNQQQIIYQQHIQEVKQDITLYENNTYIIDINKLKKLSEKKTYLFEWIYPYGFNMAQTENIIELLDAEAGKIFLSDTHCLLKDRDTLQIKFRTFKQADKRIGADFYNDVFMAENLVFEQIPYDETFEIQIDKNIAYVDAAKVTFPFILRKWEQGDIFYPFGMQGCKKVSDFYIDHKLSLFEKDATDILCNGNGDILWIIGFRSDNRYRLTSETKTVLKITLKNK